MLCDSATNVKGLGLNPRPAKEMMSILVIELPATTATGPGLASAPSIEASGC